MKKLVAFFGFGLILALTACGGGGGGAPTTAAPATTTKQAFYSASQELIEGEYFVTGTANTTINPPLAWSHDYGVVVTGTVAANELPVTVSGSSVAGSGAGLNWWPFTLTSPAYPAGTPNSKSVVIDFGTQAVHKVFVVSTNGPSMGWGLRCNTDTNCITGPITYGMVPTGMDVREIKRVALQNLPIGTVFIATTTGSATVDKVGWTIFSKM